MNNMMKYLLVGYIMSLICCMGCHKDTETTPQTDSKPTTDTSFTGLSQWYCDSNPYNHTLGGVYSYQSLAEYNGGNYFTETFQIWVMPSWGYTWIKMPATNIFSTGDSLVFHQGIYYREGMNHLVPPLCSFKIAITPNP